MTEARRIVANLLFLLPVSGGSGGAHSVMQEADAMRTLGVDAMIATNQDNAARLRRSYRDLRSIQNFVNAYQGAEGLAKLITRLRPDVVVATTAHSVHVLDAALRSADLLGVQRTAYYIQDYEPLFYPRGSSDWLLAYSSYAKIAGMLLFAKTRWLQEVVANNHGLSVAKVEPSVDHHVFHPDVALRHGRQGKLQVVAMLRPATPRRAPRRTARLMSLIAANFGERVECITFGCAPEELRANALRLAGVEHVGTLARSDVGDLFRSADLFLDLSDFQAFGRTAIEAMACGATAIVPAHGGSYEFARDGRNCFVVDTRSDDLVMAVFERWLDMPDSDRAAMMMEAIRAAYRYSPDAAALSEIDVLSRTGG